MKTNAFEALVFLLMKTREEIKAIAQGGVEVSKTLEYYGKPALVVLSKSYYKSVTAEDMKNALSDHFPGFNIGDDFSSHFSLANITASEIYSACCESDFEFDENEIIRDRLMDAVQDYLFQADGGFVYENDKLILVEILKAVEGPLNPSTGLMKKINDEFIRARFDAAASVVENITDLSDLSNYCDLSNRVGTLTFSIPFTGFNKDEIADALRGLDKVFLGEKYVLYYELGDDVNDYTVNFKLVPFVNVTENNS